MGKGDELIAKYAADLSEKCGITADMSLLSKVAKSCGPSIHSDGASTVSASDKAELERVKKNFLVKKLGLGVDSDPDGGIAAAIERYGRSNRNKHRAVFHYLLVKHFGREGAYA